MGQLEYVVKDGSGNWMNTYSLDLGEKCFGWAKQCARRSDGIVALHTVGSEDYEVVFNSKKQK